MNIKSVMDGGHWDLLGFREAVKADGQQPLTAQGKFQLKKNVIYYGFRALIIKNSNYTLTSVRGLL